MLIIKTNKNEIKASRNHTFFIDEENEIKEIPAKNLKVGHNLLRINKEFKKGAEFDNHPIKYLKL